MLTFVKTLSLILLTSIVQTEGFGYSGKPFCQYEEIRSQLKHRIHSSLNEGAFISGYPEFLDNAVLEIETSFMLELGEAPPRDEIIAYLEAQLVDTVTTFSYRLVDALLIPRTEIVRIADLKAFEVAERPIAYAGDQLFADKDIDEFEILEFLDQLIVFVFKGEEVLGPRILGAHRSLTTDSEKRDEVDRSFFKKPLKARVGDRIGDEFIVPRTIEFSIQPKVRHTVAFVENFLHECLGSNQMIFLDESILSPASDLMARRSETIVMNELQHAIDYRFLGRSGGDRSKSYMERELEVRSMQAEVIFLRDVYELSFSKIIDDVFHRYSGQDLGKEAEDIAKFDFEFPSELLLKLEEAFEGQFSVTSP